MTRGLYVKLDVAFYDDEKIIEAGEKAEVLFVRALCFMKHLASDGFISDNQLARLHLSGVQRRAASLVKAGLWERVEGGYLCPSWLNHNKSKAEIDYDRDQHAKKMRRLRARAQGNDVPGHIDDCADGTGTDVPGPETETETETETRRRRPPSDFQPTEAHRSFAAKHGLNLEAERTHWVNHCEAKGVTYVKLNAGFATWLQNAVNFGRGNDGKVKADELAW